MLWVVLIADDFWLFWSEHYINPELLFYSIGISIIFGLTGGAGRRPLRGNVFPFKYLLRNQAESLALFIPEDTIISQIEEEK